MTTKLKGLRLLELSLVDNPANKRAQVSIFKRSDEKDDNMPTPEEKIAALEAQIAALKTASDTATAALTKASADLAAAEKRATEAEAKVTEMTKAAEIAKGDEVFEAEGQSIAKSKVGPEVFAVLKAQHERIEVQKAEAFAEQHYPSLPGDVAIKGKAIRAIDAIKDEESRKAAHALLKAGEAALAMSFREVGKGGLAEVRKGDDALEALAVEHAKVNKVSIEKARAAVLDTPEGGRIYAEMENEKRRAA